MRFLPLLALLGAACASSPDAADIDRPLSPFYDRHDYVEKGETETTRKTQVRPFYWKEEGPKGKRVNVLGPLVRYREDANYKRLQIFPSVFYSARHSPQAHKSWWLIVFPLLFAGNDDFLLFPFGGYSRGLLGLDHLLMVTPLYIRTKTVSRGIDGPTTFTVRHVLFPLIAWGSDGKPGGRRKFRIAPFWGKQKHRDGSESGFILWPFYNWRRGKDSKAFFFFPFYGKTETPTRKQVTVMFPFYSRLEDYLTGNRDVALWPFFRRATGSDAIEVRRYWPFYSYTRGGYSTSDFRLWPVWRRTYLDDSRYYGKYTWVLPPFYRKIDRVSKKDMTLHRKTVLWPLFRNEHYPDGGREVAIPVVLPVDSRSIRELSEPYRPFVSLYHKRTAPNGSYDKTILFGLVMARKRPDAKKVRILGGLVGYDRNASGKYLRLLWGIRLRLSRTPQ